MNTDVQDAYRDWLRGGRCDDLSLPAIDELFELVQTKTRSGIQRLGLATEGDVSIRDLLTGRKFEYYRLRGHMVGFADIPNVGEVAVRDLNAALVAKYGRELHFNHRGQIRL